MTTALSRNPRTDHRITVTVPSILTLRQAGGATP